MTAESFDALYRLHYPVVRGYAARWTATPEDAEDAAQTAFLRAFQHRHRFRGGSVRRWLFGIMINAALDISRARGAVEALPLIEEIDLPDPRLDVEDLVLDDEERAEDAARRRAFYAALPTLTPRQRAAIDGRLNGDADEEIARRLGVKPGAVRALVHRAVRDLRARLTPEGAFP